MSKQKSNPNSLAFILKPLPSSLAKLHPVISELEEAISACYKAFTEVASAKELCESSLNPEKDLNLWCSSIEGSIKNSRPPIIDLRTTYTEASLSCFSASLNFDAAAHKACGPTERLNTAIRQAIQHCNAQRSTHSVIGGLDYQELLSIRCLAAESLLNDLASLLKNRPKPTDQFLLLDQIYRELYDCFNNPARSSKIPIPYYNTPAAFTSDNPNIELRKLVIIPCFDQAILQELPRYSGDKRKFDQADNMKLLEQIETCREVFEAWQAAHHLSREAKGYINEVQHARRLTSSLVYGKLEDPQRIKEFEALISDQNERRIRYATVTAHERTLSLALQNALRTASKLLAAAVAEVERNKTCPELGRHFQLGLAHSIHMNNCLAVDSTLRSWSHAYKNATNSRDEDKQAAHSHSITTAYSARLQALWQKYPAPGAKEASYL